MCSLWKAVVLVSMEGYLWQRTGVVYASRACLRWSEGFEEAMGQGTDAQVQVKRMS